MASVFPAPDHDHGRCSADTLKHAEALCAKRGERLTPMRRYVLEVLAASHKPVGAYEIIDAVAARGPRPPRSPSIARSIFSPPRASCIASRAATRSLRVSTITRATRR